VIRRSLAVGVALTVVSVLSAPVSFADGVNDLPPITQAQLDSSVRDISLPISDLQLPVKDVDTTTTKGTQTIVSLKSDILFAFGKSALSEAAATKIAALLAKVPKSAQVKVYGYTDNIGSSASNRRLSQARARSVAAAIHASRLDLRLSEHGYGESRPVAPNTSGGKDDPEGRAKNRRVEIRFARY
jgi:outer membrane protein OmpA-like peptidoglycan-associated protein